MLELHRLGQSIDAKIRTAQEALGILSQVDKDGSTGKKKPYQEFFINHMKTAPHHPTSTPTRVIVKYTLITVFLNLLKVEHIFLEQKWTSR